MMIYNNIVSGRFQSRPNRFIAHCEINGVLQRCHVKNTGRCHELLTENAHVLLEKVPTITRKTAYDLIAVYKGERLINMDSQAPNKVFAEYIPTLFPKATSVRAEKTFLHSRFDFYVETPSQKIFIEVKGVTLEKDGYALFPDAPTERGVKHIHELMAAIAAGFDAYFVFIVQMSSISHLSPNDVTHKAFGVALRQAIQAGVKVIALTCSVTENTLLISGEIPIIF